MDFFQALFPALIPTSPLSFKLLVSFITLITRWVFQIIKTQIELRITSNRIKQLRFKTFQSAAISRLKINQRKRDKLVMKMLATLDNSEKVVKIRLIKF